MQLYFLNIYSAFTLSLSLIHIKEELLILVALTSIILNLKKTFFDK